MRTYVRAWFTSTSPTETPYHDYNFVCQLVHYPSEDIGSATIEKFRNHLSSENAAFSFFDYNVLFKNSPITWENYKNYEKGVQSEKN